MTSKPKVFDLLPKRRGRQTESGCFGLFPQQTARSRHYIYAIAFVGGVVKVGRTRNVRGRLLQHAKQVNGEVLWAHVFEPGGEYYGRIGESRALDALALVCERVNRSEWFRCEDKALVIRTVRSALSQVKPQADKWEAERVASAKRSALAARLLAEHEAQTKKTAV